jgi:hypothetical protein
MNRLPCRHLLLALVVLSVPACEAQPVDARRARTPSEEFWSQLLGSRDGAQSFDATPSRPSSEDATMPLAPKPATPPVAQNAGQDAYPAPLAPSSGQSRDAYPPPIVTFDRKTGEMSMMTAPGVTSTPNPQREALQTNFEALEKEAAEVAQRIRSSLAGAEKPDDLPDELRQAVAQAFAARQKLHWAELSFLQQRVLEIQRTIEKREQLKEQIIDRRAAELLDPTLQWNATGTTQTLHPAIPKTAGRLGGPMLDDQTEKPSSNTKVPDSSQVGKAQPGALRAASLKIGNTVATGRQVATVQAVDESAGHVLLRADGEGFSLEEQLVIARREGMEDTTVWRGIAQVEVFQVQSKQALARIVRAMSPQTGNISGPSETDNAEIKVGDIAFRLPSAPAMNDPKTASAMNVKKIMLAMHHYVDTYRHFPPAVMLGKDGRGGPPHSWRVAILPQLGEHELYNEYRFDEPWDSDHNKKLLEKMPAVFRGPLDAPDSTNTSYFGLVAVGTTETNEVEGMEGGGAAGGLFGAGGDAAPAVTEQTQGGTPLGPAFTPPAPIRLPRPHGTLLARDRGVQMGEVTDGTSNTIAIIESKLAVPWTRPHDLAYLPDQALPVLGGWYSEGFYAGFADGTAKFLAADNDEATLRALFTIGAGENVTPRLVNEKQSPESLRSH